MLRHVVKLLRHHPRLVSHGRDGLARPAHHVRSSAHVGVWLSRRCWDVMREPCVTRDNNQVSRALARHLTSAWPPGVRVWLVVTRGAAVHLGEAGGGRGGVGLRRGGGRVLTRAPRPLATPHGGGLGLAGATVRLGHDGDHARAGGYHPPGPARPRHDHPDDGGRLAGVAGVQAGLVTRVPGCHELRLVTRHAPGNDGMTRHLEGGGQIRPASRACSVLASLSSLVSWWPPRSGLSLDAIRRVYLDSTGSWLHLLSRLARVTGRDAGYGLTPSCHHVLGTSVDKHPIIYIDMSHSHLSWGQNVCSCLTESLRDTRHGIHAIGRVRSLRAGRGGGNS